MNGLNIPIQTLFVAIIFCVAVLVAFIASAGVLRKLYLSWRTPTTWISALPDRGWVEVLGKVRGDTLKSPYQNAECAYWQLEVQEYQNRSRSGAHWITILRESSGNFTVDDMTGRIQVQDGRASLLTNKQTVVESSNADAKDFLEGRGIKTTGFLGFIKTCACTSAW